MVRRATSRSAERPDAQVRPQHTPNQGPIKPGHVSPACAALHDPTNFTSMTSTPTTYSYGHSTPLDHDVCNLYPPHVAQTYFAEGSACDTTTRRPLLPLQPPSETLPRPLHHGAPTPPSATLEIGTALEPSPNRGLQTPMSSLLPGLLLTWDIPTTSRPALSTPTSLHANTPPPP
jgi:hypothetical protein